MYYLLYFRPFSVFVLFFCDHSSGFGQVISFKRVPDKWSDHSVEILLRPPGGTMSGITVLAVRSSGVAEDFSNTISVSDGPLFDVHLSCTKK